MREVATAAAVSVGTVSNVLNRPEIVSEETAARVIGAIERLGFVRNDGARQLRVGHNGSIGLVVPDLRNPFFAEIARAAESRAAREGLAVLVADSAGDAEREARHLALFEEQRAFGILLAPVAGSRWRARLSSRHALKTVLVGEKGEALNIPSVAVDDVEGGRLAAAHLLRSGHTRLAFIGGTIQAPQVRDRLTGAGEAATAAGAVLEYIPTDTLTADAGRDIGRVLLGRAVADRPGALFAANDQVGLGVMEVFAVSGKLRVPDDVIVIGYDDIDFASAAIVPLSSVRQPSDLLGEAATEMLLGCSEVAHRVLHPSLVLRRSTLAQARAEAVASVLGSRGECRNSACGRL